jgi:hypothetical protein
MGKRQVVKHNTFIHNEKEWRQYNNHDSINARGWRTYLLLCLQMNYNV